MAKEKHTTPHKALSKKTVKGSVIVGTLLAGVLTFTGCINLYGGENGTAGTVWKSGKDYSEFANAKIGDYFIDTDDYQLWQKTADAWVIVMEN